MARTFRKMYVPNDKVLPAFSTFIFGIFVFVLYTFIIKRKNLLLIR
ncbi:CAAX amino terminal protease family [Bacillus cereus]|nr:CAAX amino terminal protease family [Bacillus cereus]